MDLYFISNLIITIALIMQLQSPYEINKNAFLFIALATFIMAYAHLRYGSTHKYNLPLKVVNGALALMIFYQT